jgi:hypothetical protein
MVVSCGWVDKGEMRVRMKGQAVGGDDPRE